MRRSARAELMSYPPYPAILVVDDDDTLRELIVACLERIGFTAAAAANVSQARDLIRNQPFSMVLSDYAMPDGTGLDLVRFVGEVLPDLPVILLTGRDETALAREAISLGAIDFLTKPFNLEQLSRILEQNRARVDRERLRLAERTAEVLSGTVRALVAAIDAKDPHTALHSERVTEISLRLGREIGLSPDRLQVLEFAGLLHDVGKIGVPEGLLLKHGKLNESEWAVLRQHPVRSCEIVLRIGRLNEVASIVRHHHERIDGRGYPDGVAGEAIPYLSRVLGIADAYEAMTADRSYRKALTPTEARGAIRDGLGSQFDRSLGQVFLQMPHVI